MFDPVHAVDTVGVESGDGFPERERVADLREGAGAAVDRDDTVTVHHDHGVTGVVDPRRDSGVDVVVGRRAVLPGDDPDRVAVRALCARTDGLHHAAEPATDDLVASLGEFLAQSFGRRVLRVGDGTPADHADSHDRVTIRRVVWVSTGRLRPGPDLDLEADVTEPVGQRGADCRRRGEHTTRQRGVGVVFEQRHRRLPEHLCGRAVPRTAVGREGALDDELAVGCGAAPEERDLEPALLRVRQRGTLTRVEEDVLTDRVPDGVDRQCGRRHPHRRRHTDGTRRAAEAVTGRDRLRTPKLPTPGVL